MPESETNEVTERRVSRLIEGVILVMLSMISYLLVQSDRRVEQFMVEANKEIGLNRIDNQQMRLDFTEFSSGTIGNRFTQADWRNQSERLDEKMRDAHQRLQEQIDDIKQSVRSK